MRGIKLFDPFTRKDGIDLADFSHHWITRHAEIVRRIPRVTRYVQSVRLDTRSPFLEGSFGASTWDGCAETWHADRASIAAMVDEPLFPELMADEYNFLDLSKPRYLIQTLEQLLDESGFDPRIRGEKLLVFARRAPDLSREEFTTAWTATARETVEIGRRLGVTRHVLCSSVGQVLRDAERDPDSPSPIPVSPSIDEEYEGVRELWWPDARAMEIALNADSRAALRLVAPGCIDPHRSSALVAHERVIIS